MGNRSASKHSAEENGKIRNSANKHSAEENGKIRESASVILGDSSSKGDAMHV